MHEFVDKESPATAINQSEVHAENAPTSTSDNETARSFKDGCDKCWKGYSSYGYIWIITGPMTVVLFVRTHVSKVKQVIF